ncbi:unnamed protein product [Acanthoscelides obtectus]|uniref:Uncharacterized protein n=1 Tax=Acanthoscelides obtectus TaxID=200917 RepID=A0A9P0M4H6_ACAOB|nr:unnamed protein product [Acanthoscelides obtectus]CAK1674069.1 hypothetical protein AOBTE_LOCUS29524 [Acanthoscelides obtectus]
MNNVRQAFFQKDHQKSRSNITMAAVLSTIYALSYTTISVVESGKKMQFLNLKKFINNCFQYPKSRKGIWKNFAKTLSYLSGFTMNSLNYNVSLLSQMS